MSRQGERIGRRLARRHGFKFLYDPCNFRVASDPEGVARNNYGGQGVMQWILKMEERNTGLPRMGFRGQFREAEIGSDHGAWAVLGWNHWHVYYDDDLCGNGAFSLIFWIHNGHGQDRTEVPA